MKKLLMIDAEKDFCYLIKKSLEAGLPDYRVLVANNGEDGVMMALRDKPSLILLDILLPGMDGFEVLRILKEKLETTSIPVIVLTAEKADEAKKRSSSLYHEDYIIKPFKSLELIKKIKDVLSRKN